VEPALIVTFISLTGKNGTTCDIVMASVVKDVNADSSDFTDEPGNVAYMNQQVRNYEVFLCVPCLLFHYEFKPDQSRPKTWLVEN